MSTYNKQSRFDNHIDYKKYGPGPGEYKTQSIDKKVTRPKIQVNHLSNQIKEINGNQVTKSDNDFNVPGPGYYDHQQKQNNTNTVKHIYHDQKKRFDYEKNTDQYLQSQIQKQNNLILYMSQQQDLDNKKQEITKQMAQNNYYFMEKNSQNNLIYQDKDVFQKDKHNVKDFKKLQQMNLNQRSNFNNIANQIIDCYDLKDKSKSMQGGEKKQNNGRIVFNYQVIQPFLQQKIESKQKEKKLKQLNEPGPGCYEISEQKNKKNCANLAGAIMKSESLRNCQLQFKSQTTGPGSYNSNAPNKKKNFNYNFNKGWI